VVCAQSSSFPTVRYHDAVHVSNGNTVDGYVEVGEGGSQVGKIKLEALRADGGVGRVPNAVCVNCVVSEQLVSEVGLAFAEEVAVVFMCSISHCVCVV